MNYQTPDSLRLVTCERLDQRRREGDNERLAREIRGTGARRWRPRLAGWLVLGATRHAGQPRLEA
jgi:hypothetical protein